MNIAQRLLPWEMESAIRVQIFDETVDFSRCAYIFGKDISSPPYPNCAEIVRQIGFSNNEEVV